MLASSIHPVKLTEDLLQCLQERKEEEKKETVTKTKMSNGQVDT